MALLYCGPMGGSFQTPASCLRKHRHPRMVVQQRAPAPELDAAQCVGVVTPRKIGSATTAPAGDGVEDVAAKRLLGHAVNG